MVKNFTIKNYKAEEVTVVFKDRCGFTDRNTIMSGLTHMHTKDESDRMTMGEMFMVQQGAFEVLCMTKNIDWNDFEPEETTEIWEYLYPLLFRSEESGGKGTVVGREDKADNPNGEVRPK